MEKRGPIEDIRRRIRFRLATSSMAHRLRELSNGSRAMPSFLIVGAQKAGTTFLHQILSQHPQILEPWRKEVNYFSFRYSNGPSWYRANFPKKRAGAITGEGTTNYMFHPYAAERIAKELPDVKLIVLLREGSSRAVSHHRMNIDRSEDTVSFKEAIETENARTAGEIEKLRDPAYQAWAFRRYTYRARAMYLEQILRLEAHFPKENILVLDSKDLFKKTDETVFRAEKFIGVSEWKPKEYLAENVGKVKVEADPETVAWLKEFYREPDAALFEHLKTQPLW